jgi:hypothetical protein
MALMKKEFEHKGFKLKTSVELNIPHISFRTERVGFHKITTICERCNFYKTAHVDTSSIEEYVNMHQQHAIEYIDEYVKEPESAEVLLLLKLGFV